MKPTKPDRFDQIAADNIEWHTPAGTPMISSYEVAKLLRREHAWMKRMVKKVDAWACQELADNDDVIAEILKQLAQRRK